jgi:cell division protein FtsA
MSKKQEAVVFDIGSNKIAALIGLIDAAGNIEVKDKFLGKCEGIKSSVITNLSQAEESIINTVFSVEKTSKQLIKEASISICASSAKSSYVNAKVRILGQSVTKQDVQKLISKALDNFSESGQEVIHYFPIEFTLDNSIGITDPVGLLGKELSCNLHIVSVDSQVLTNMINCLNKCQIKVKDVILSVYASGLGCISSVEQQAGVLIVDFGSRATSFGVLLEGKLVYFGYVPLGSWYITSDIAKAFSISMSSAEKLKVLYGSGKFIDTATMINLEDIDPDEFSKNQVVSVSDLSAVISPRVEEIFTLLKAEYSKLKVDDLIASNMIITGAGSSLDNIAEVVGDIFFKAVKVDNAIKSFKADTPDENGYVTAFGMLNYIAAKQKEKLSLANNIGNQGVFSKMWSWFKENI